jgi:hypothetical protein
MAVSTATGQAPLNFSTKSSVEPQSSNSTRKQEKNEAWHHLVAGGLVLLRQSK